MVQGYKLNTIPDLTRELTALLPGFRSYSASRIIENYPDKKSDTLLLVIIKTEKAIKIAEREQLNTWLLARTKSDTLKLIFE